MGYSTSHAVVSMPRASAQPVPARKRIIACHAHSIRILNLTRPPWQSMDSSRSVRSGAAGRLSSLGALPLDQQLMSLEKREPTDMFSLAARSPWPLAHLAHPIWPHSSFPVSAVLPLQATQLHLLQQLASHTDSEGSVSPYNRPSIGHCRREYILPSGYPVNSRIQREALHCSDPSHEDHRTLPTRSKSGKNPGAASVVAWQCSPQ